MSGIDAHHTMVRFLWRLVRADGTCGDISIDFGEVGPDGRLVKIAGFFGAPPRSVEPSDAVSPPPAAFAVAPCRLSCHDAEAVSGA